jgi:hypothetical protein
MIIIGIALTVSIIFILIGIPLIIIGTILLILSILLISKSLLAGIIGGFFRVIYSFRPRKKGEKTTRKKLKSGEGNKKIIEVSEKEGVFEPEK